jgi:hypothetical protein
MLVLLEFDRVFLDGESVNEYKERPPDVVGVDGDEPMVANMNDINVADNLE